MEPIDIANALKINRPELGNQVGLGLYRLLRLVALEDIMGPGASSISYYAGKKLGEKLEVTSLEGLLDFCKQINIGKISLEKINDSKIHVDVHECATCAGMDPVGRPICHFEGGLIAGALESITHKKIQAKEVTCIGGLGDETCGFDLELKTIPKQ
jgi:predicted hydrocarbon binding protein